MEAEHPLFELQQLDLEVRGLEADHRGLPERAAIEACDAELAQLELQSADVGARSAALAAKIEALECETQPLSERIQTEEAKLYSGAVSAVKELEALQEEIRSLGERKELLEEDELTTMEEQEGTTAELRGIEARREEVRQQRGELEARLREREAAIEATIEQKRSARAPFDAAIAPKLLSAYERLRGQRSLAGQVVTLLKGRNCARCGLAVREMALTALRSSADTVHCDGCGRIILPAASAGG